MLEYQHHVSVRYQDHSFWDEVRRHSAAHRQASIAIGLTTLLSRRIFGGEAPPELEEWTSACLPASVRLWADQYGRESILADFPGTKLYLLLQEELPGDHGSAKQTKRTSLLPLHRAPRIVSASTHDSVWTRIRAKCTRYASFFFASVSMLLQACTTWSRPFAGNASSLLGRIAMV